MPNKTLQPEDLSELEKSIVLYMHRKAPPGRMYRVTAASLAQRLHKNKQDIQVALFRHARDFPLFLFDTDSDGNIDYDAIHGLTLFGEEIAQKLVDETDSSW